MKSLKPIVRTTAIFRQSGAMEPGYGKVTGVIAFVDGMTASCIRQRLFPFIWRR